MATYLVTGGCGFIGSHLADALIAGGHAVRILDDLSTGRRENAPAAAQLVIGSICDRDAVARAMRGADGCFHLAAIASVARSIEDPAGTRAVNLAGTLNVFEAAIDAPGGPLPVVYASSAAVYGDGGAGRLRETAPARPLSPYGADKLECERGARAAGAADRLPSFGLRPFNIYGPRQDPASPYSGVIALFLARALAGEPLVIHGDGGQVRDFVHVSDAVRAFRAALDAASPKAPVANICTGRGTSVADLARTVVAIAARPVALQYGPARPGDIRHSIGDPGEARRRLGWEARIGLAEGLRTALEALRA